MKFQIKKIRFSVSFPAVAFFALALVYDHGGNLLWCLISSVLHELGHILAMHIFKVKIKCVSVNLGDIKIVSDCSRLSMREDIIVSLSGVGLNLILCVVFGLLKLLLNSDVFLQLLRVNLCIGVFNALPVRYLDGGQILSIILSKQCSYETTERILNITSIVFLVPIAVLGLLFVLQAEFNFSLLFAVLYLVYTIISKELS